MTAKHLVADEILGRLSRKQWELTRRTLEGTLDIDQVLRGLQNLIEGQLVNQEPLPFIQTAIIKNWELFYLEVFNQKVDFSKVVIPDNGGSGLKFLQIIPAKLSYWQLHSQEKKDFGQASGANDNWPSAIDMRQEARSLDRDYAIWHHGGLEPDHDSMVVDSSQCMTRLERGIFGLYMWWKYQIIIDTRFKTLCNGSNTHYDAIPLVGYNNQSECLDSGILPRSNREHKCRSRRILTS
jgi:hypothetical protein